MRQIKERTSYYTLLWILLPFVLTFVAEALQNLNKPLSTQLKLLAVIYMIVYIVLHKINFNLLIISLLFLVFLGANMVNPYNWNAALEEGVRYLFPIVALMFGYAIRKHARILVRLFVYFVIINDLWQVINYINWLRDVDQWFYYHTWNGIPYYNATMGIIRATGLVVFFSLFGFINAVAYFLIKYYYEGRYRKLFMWITFISVFISFSYKTIGAFLFLLFLSARNKLKILSGIVLGLVMLTIIFPEKSSEIVQDLALRIKFYVTEGNSARSESYRMMFKHTKLFLGEGVGTFGGAASTKYHSPVYEKFHFNWYETTWITTTDTYYPHLFVELGLLAAFIYLLLIVYPLINRMPVKRLRVVYYIYFLLFVEALLTFALNHLGYVMSSLALVYPLIYLTKRLNGNRYG